MRSDQDIVNLYADRVNSFNIRLRQWAEFDPNCSFLPMKGLHENMEDKLFDGIHLDRWGRDRLRAEMRRSVIVQTLKMRD